MKKMFNNLRFRLVFLVLLSVIPALVITYLSGREQLKQARLQAVEDAYRYTRLVAVYQNSLIDSTRQLLQSISQEPQLLDPTSCKPYLQRLHSIYPIYTAISTATLDGNLYCSSIQNVPSVNLADRPYFQQALQEKKFVVGEIITDRLTGKPILPMALSVFDEQNSLAGVLIASIDLSQVLSYGMQLDLPPQSAILIVNQEGSVLLRYPQAEIWSGKNLSQAPIIHEILQSRGEGNAEAQGIDGVTRLYAFTPATSAPNQETFVSVGIPTAIAYAVPNQIMRTTLAWIGIAALFALFTAWFGGDILFLRVVSLTAERDQAERELQVVNAQLEARVEERTSELAASNTALAERSIQLTSANDQLQRELVERQKMVEILHQHESELNDLLQKLEQSNQDLQHFAYIASHDLQEPLRKVQAFGERLARRYAGQLGEEGVGYLERMNSSARRMQSMINDLLTYSRVTTQGKKFTQVDLKKVVNEVVSDLEIRIREAGGQVLLKDLPTIEADPVQMHQLFQNLISNGLKFHRPGVKPVITVSGEVLEDGGPKDCQAMIVVEDNGIGFDEKYLDRIFQPFQRLHSRDQFEGSGIGLAVCRRIVERHQGQITANSNTNVGSAFIITLPVKQSKND